MIRVMLADDHRIFREGLRSLLSTHVEMEVVAEVDNGRDVLAVAEQSTPDIVIMNIGMPALDAAETTRRLTRDNGNPRIIGLSVHEDRPVIWQFLAAGGAACLLKECRMDELLTAVRWVSEGEVYLSPSVTRGLLKDFKSRRRSGEDTPFVLLTAREREVLQLLVEGRTAKEAAGDLEISFKTVNTHRQNIMEKLNMHSMAELTRYAIREGLSAL